MLQTSVLLLGVNGVGKTSWLLRLKYDEKMMTIPTMGFNHETIDYKERQISIWDLSGANQTRGLWKNYFKDQKCIIYMIDISSKKRLDEYIESFQLVLDIHKNYKNIPIIIFCNKFNGKEEFEPEEFLSKVNIPPEVSSTIIKGNVIDGEGRNELLEYIYNNIQFEEEKKEEKEEEKGKTEPKILSKENEEYQVSMFGLNGSGRTVILYLLYLGEKVKTLTSIGFNAELIKFDNWEKNIKIWDIPGVKEQRKFWPDYCNKINGLIWVYDISDEKLIEENQNELIKLLSLPQIKENMPLLIYANKSDLNKNENKPEAFLNGIQEKIKNRPYFVQVCNVNDIESYKTGLSWLYNNLNA